jgi:hypothetical protein
LHDLTPLPFFATLVSIGPRHDWPSVSSQTYPASPGTIAGAQQREALLSYDVIMHGDWLARREDILKHLDLTSSLRLDRLTAAGAIQGMFKGISGIGGLDAVVSQLRRSTTLAGFPAVEDAIRYGMPRLDELRLYARLAPQLSDSIAHWVDELSRSLLSAADSQGPTRALAQNALCFQAQVEDIADGLLGRYAFLSREQVFQPLERVINSLAGIRGVVETLGPSQEAVDCALSVAGSYSRYCQKQYSLAQCDSVGVGARRLVLTDLAGSILDAHQSMWEQLASALGPIEPNLRGPIVLAPNVFTETNRQLAYVYRDDSEADPTVAFERCDAVASSTLGSTIVSLVVAINETSNAADGTDVFKITNKSVQASVVLTATVATSETTFGQVVDGLYFILYEAGGKVKRLAGRYPNCDLEPLKIVKTLRNGMRHDIETWRQEDIREEQKRLGEAYVAICGLPRPAASSAWRRAQSALYRRVTDMLDAMLHSDAARWQA